MTSPDEPQFPDCARIAFSTCDPADERRRESLFCLGNGVLLVRACSALDGLAAGSRYAGTYRAGCYDRDSLRLNRRSFGHASLVNLPNWLPVTFRVLGEADWFVPDGVTMLAYRHELDMRSGTATRRALVQDANGRRTWLHEQLLVSMVRPQVAALRVELRPLNWSAAIELRSAIDGGTMNRNTDHDILRGHRHLDAIRTDAQTALLLLGARTRHSHRRIAVAARTRIDGHAIAGQVRDGDRTAQHAVRPAQAGVATTIEKIAAIVTDGDPAVRDPASAAGAAAAGAPDFGSLQVENRRSWDALWQRAWIQAANPQLQTAARFHAFHLLQTASPHSARLDLGLPSRGWQEAYHGHVFWDETFALPFLNYRFPEIARGLLLYRWRRLDEARRAARAAGYAGAMFPWRSAASGADETPCFQINPLSRRRRPDHTRLQHHIGAAVAHNVWQYYLATGDAEFLSRHGVETIVEVARFWASAARCDGNDGRYGIRGVIGPDEYHNAYPGAERPGLDDNAYTNVMAALTLLRAGAALDMLPRRRRDTLLRALRLGADERNLWQHVAQHMRLCFTGDGVLSQFQGFGRLKRLDRAEISALQTHGRLDWVLDARGDTVNAYQVTKQADVLMLLYLIPQDELAAAIRQMGYAVDDGCLRRTARYYLERITHESSLSRPVCAGALAAIDPQTSWDFFQASLCVDLDPAKSASCEEGLHLGAMGATFDVLQRHYLGLRTDGHGIVLAPAPPGQLGAVRMPLRHGDCLLVLDWNGGRLRVTADPANRVAVSVRHGASRCMLDPGRVLDFEAGRRAAPR